MGDQVYCPISAFGWTPSGLDLCMLCFCHSLSKFLLLSPVMSGRQCFLGIHSLWLLKSFCLFYHRAPTWGVWWKKSYLGQGVPRSSALHIVQVWVFMGSHLLQEKVSLMVAKYDTALLVYSCLTYNKALLRLKQTANFSNLFRVWSVSSVFSIKVVGKR